MCELWKRNWEAAFNERLTDFVAMQLKARTKRETEIESYPLRKSVAHICTRSTREQRDGQGRDSRRDVKSRRRKKRSG